MVKKIILIMVLTMVSVVNPNLVSADVGLDSLKSATDFKLFTPHYSTKSWKLEIKEPYPLDLDRSIMRVRLHYFDKSGQTYMFGVEQHKAKGYKIKRSETIIDVRNKTSTTKVIEEDFKFDTSGENEEINGIEARFQPWGDGTSGGVLRWVQDGTYIEIDSMQLSQKLMVKLAESMK